MCECVCMGNLVRLSVRCDGDSTLRSVLRNKSFYQRIWFLFSFWLTGCLVDWFVGWLFSLGLV